MALPNLFVELLIEALISNPPVSKPANACEMYVKSSLDWPQPISIKES